MNTLQSYIYFVLIITFFSGCGSLPVSPIEQDQDIIKNSKNMGYLILGVTTDFLIYSVEFEGEDNFVINKFTWLEDRNYFVAPVQKGKYRISKVTLFSNRYYDLEFEDISFSFEVAPNSINYAGELRLKKHRSGFASFELMNRSSLALEFLEAKFPTLLENKALIYQGPGESSFYELVGRASIDTRSETAL